MITKCSYSLDFLKAAYGEQLVSSFREEGMKKFGLEHYRKFNGAPLEVLGRSGSEPTFWEFVQGIVREGKYVKYMTYIQTS